jgi:hypothetical protein
LTQQFRFDSGWKTAALRQSEFPLEPAIGLSVEIPEVGRGRIHGLKKWSKQSYKLRVTLDDGKTIDKIFNPATMKLSAE